MNLNEFQYKAHEFAFYKDDHYPEYGLAEEVGEFMGKIAKSMRGDYVLDREDLKKEMGDILWMLAECATKHEFELNDIAETNILKLNDRAKRGKLSGDGDNR